MVNIKIEPTDSQTKRLCESSNKILSDAFFYKYNKLNKMTDIIAKNKKNIKD